ncbi:MAG: aromatic ring-hydroxylating dioxygenase subunit alpha [Planctomycetaceae bacterium]|jgi:Rieske 2Fe-2S family protein|nr:aromatic ring-hydroxylating dioxygenase subunit alpha [Planctomycetaceae bacterium]
MPGISPHEHDHIMKLVARRQPGHGLPTEFYVDELVYQAELERIWRRGWLFAGHTCQVPQPGDYFTLDVGSDPLIVIRDDEGSIRALHNVCRHRGAELCTAASGRIGRFICPYHQWAYARDGSLQSCRGMQADLDTSDLGLHGVHVQVLEGLVFISLAEEPPAFDLAAALIGPAARPQGFEQARVAKIVDYDVAANWKIVWENNRECYHCNVNHPQYIQANFDHYNADDTTPQTQAAIDAASARSQEKWAASGLAVTHTRTGMTSFPACGPDGWFSANRTPLVDGYLSETMDGRQVAPLMGDYSDPDVGTLRMRTMPNFWNHSSCDHGVSTRLLPAGIGRTRVQVTWLVAGDAEEDRDYRLDEIMPFWQLTSEQDWTICESVQRGVGSSRYTPGPFSTYKEYNVDALVNWYLEQVGSQP